jgi:hypothetical protein
MIIEKVFYLLCAQNGDHYCLSLAAGDDDDDSYYCHYKLHRLDHDR